MFLKKKRAIRTIAIAWGKEQAEPTDLSRKIVGNIPAFVYLSRGMPLCLDLSVAKIC